MNTTELNIEFSKLIELKNKVDKLKQLQKESVQRYFKKKKIKYFRKEKKNINCYQMKKKIIKAKRNEYYKNKYYTDKEYRTKTLTKCKELYKKQLVKTPIEFPDLL